MSSERRPSPRWYDRLARVVALVALGYLAAQLLPPLLPGSEAPPSPRSGAAVTTAALPEAPPPPKLAALLDPATHPAFDGRTPSIADVAEAVLPSVVSITSRGTSRGHQGGGSGVIVAPDGVVLTNNHVVTAARDLTVTLDDGREFDAKVVGTDPLSDLAVLKLIGAEDHRLVPARLGDSDALRVGDPVLAIGNMLMLRSTVTLGIVSALGRGNLGIVGDQGYEDFIQTDAAINPGNSGGALVNARGELVGINTAIMSQTGGSDGIGLAVPTNLAQPIMESLLATGKVERGWLGVKISDFTPAMADDPRRKVPTGTRGVLVAEVLPGTPGQAAGLRAGDVVMSVDGKPTENTSRLRNTVAHRHAGEVVELELYRHGELLPVDVELGVLPEQPTEPRSFHPWRR